MKDEILKLLKDTLYKPLDEIEILQELEIPRKETGSFLAALDELESEGRVYRTKKKKYILPEKAGLVAGTLSRTKKGFGFVIPFYDKKGDIYIPSQLMGGALDGDMVMALILSNQVKPGGAGSREGEIKKVLKRGRNKFLCGKWKIRIRDGYGMRRGYFYFQKRSGKSQGRRSGDGKNHRMAGTWKAGGGKNSQCAWRQH